MTSGATITVHYPKGGLNGDYYDVAVDIHLGASCGYDEPIHLHRDYGDSYHDQGWEKAEGMADCLKLLYGSKFPILWLHVDDREE